MAEDDAFADGLVRVVLLCRGGVTPFAFVFRLLFVGTVELVVVFPVLKGI